MRGIRWRREAADDDENDRINDHAAEADVEEGLELAGAGDQRAAFAEEEGSKRREEEDDNHAGDQSRYRTRLGAPTNINLSGSSYLLGEMNIGDFTNKYKN